MKRKFYVILVLMLLLLVGLAGCKNKHKFASDWSHDEEYHWHACSHCDEVADKAAHAWDNGVVTKELTLTENGVKTYTCTVCGATKTEELKHNFSTEWSSDETSHWHACSDCDTKKDNANHTWDAGKVTKEPTSSAKGEKTFTCSVCGKTKVEEVAKLQTVAEAIASNNNATVEFNAVVFGKTSDGFYVSDGTTGAYVKLAESQSGSFAGLKVGDEVKVSGKLSVSNSQIFVKNASVNVLASDKTPLAATEATIEVIQALAASDRENYGKLFTLTGAISLDEANRMFWTDSTGTILFDDSCKSAFNDFIGAKVSADITLLKMGDGSDGWIAYAFADTIEEYIVDIDAVKDEVFASVSVEEELWGTLELTTSYEPEPGVKFTWSVKSGDGITINDNAVAIDLSLAADSAVVLTLTISAGEKSASKDFNTTVKAIESVDIATGKTKEGYVVLNAVVAATGLSHESNPYSYVILMDETTKEYAIACVSSEQRASAKSGNKVQIVAKYANLEGHDDLFAFQDVKSFKVTAEGETLDYTTLNAVELRTAADYQDVIDNHHQEIVLYKIVNPWLVGSGSTSFSWYQFGPEKDSAANGIINSRQFCFLIANFAVNGMTQWESQYNVPTKDKGANHYTGTVIYAYSVYQLGETKWPFIIPNVGCSIQDVSEAVRYEVEQSIDTEVLAQEAGVFVLPTSVTVDGTEYALTWESSNNELINASTGAYPQLLDPAEVTLTAKYTCNLKEYAVAIKVSMLAAEITPLTVSEAITAGSANITKLNAYVAAIGTSSENSEEYRYGIMLTDGKQVIYYQTTDYKVGEVDIKAGDLLQIRNCSLVVDNDGNTLQNGSVTIVSSGNTIDYSELQLAATVSNDEELATFLSGHGATRGLVVKFTGTMNIVGTGSSSKNPRYQINYKQATSSADSRYSMNGTNRSLVLSLNAYKLLDPENEWWTALGIPPTTGSKCFTVCGTFYAVGGYNGATMQAWTIIKPAEIDVQGTIETIITEKMKDFIKVEEISASTAGELALPAKVNYNSADDLDVTWETSNSDVMTAAGAYSAVTSDTQVTMTAKVMAGTKELTKAFTITLKAAEAKKLTVAEVLALEDGTAVEAMVATVAGFATGTSGTASTYPTEAMYLTDGTNIIGLDAFAGEVHVSSYDVTFGTDETPLAVGDKVELTNLTKNGSAVQATDSTSATKTGVEEGNAWFNPTVDDAHTLDSQDDIAALMLTVTANSVKCSTTHNYTVYKLVGTNDNPFYIGRANGYTLPFFFKGTLADNAAITDTVVTPGSGYTVGSGKYCYFSTHVASLGKAINNDEWAIANTPITGKTGNYVYACAAGTTIYDFAYTGTMYIIQSSTGSSSYPYIFYGVLGAGLNIVKK